MGLALANLPDIEDEGQVGLEGLTEKRKKFVQNVLAGMKPAKAAEVAGYAHPHQAANYLTHQSSIRQALQRESERVLLTEGLSNSLRFMVTAPMNERLPGAVRFQAAKWVMETCGHGLAVQRAALGLPGDDKPLEEMSVGELEAFLSAGQSAIAAIKARDGIIDHDARNVEASTLGQIAQVVDPKGDGSGV